MPAPLPNIRDFGMDTISLAGTLPAKLAAIRDAGFSQIMLSARDLVGHAEGIDAAVDVVRASGLRVTGFQVLRDFEGLSGHLHEYKIDVAKSMLEMCHALGATVLLVCSSTSTHATGDPDALARDLRKLAMLAVPLGINVAYEGLSWGRTINEFTTAWDVVVPRRRAQPRHRHRLVPHLRDQDVARRPRRARPRQDLPGAARRLHVAGSAHAPRSAWRPRAISACFPGEGVHSEALAELVTRLDGIGYRGDYSFEVFNDDYQQMPLSTVAARARRSALWLGEDVLRRAVPLPNRMRLQRSNG